jgi:quinohemoprotein ethanol dehydrogenase
MINNISIVFLHCVEFSVPITKYCRCTFLLFISLFVCLPVQAEFDLDAIRAATGSVNTESIVQQSDADWLSYGKDYKEQRYSTLDTINDGNVDQLGLTWFFETDYGRGLEATPLIVDGVMYVSGSWSTVYALDARNGQLLWKYDPKVPKEWGKMACCGVVNRGVALYEGKVFVGTLDARLVALDAVTGNVLWDVQTADLSQYPYSITGAPRAAKGKVFIGNSGAEYGVKGFVTAYDVDTGELIWRFYTVPGNPATDDDQTTRMAAKTWTGEWWKHGGGGTVWDSIVYDDELDQLYLGVGNGSPWNRHIRSPDGGDNLFLSSIVALNPDTGDYLWHYQETPAESWDYTATQHIMLADMQWKGESKKVIWQAPKNGFFFIIDRENGNLLSAEPYARVTWATHYDMETGRPVEVPGADYKDGPVTLFPSSAGAHNWQPMTYSPKTGLVYIPAMETPYRFESVEDYIHEWGQFNFGSVANQGIIGNDLLQQALMSKVTLGHLVAWDPKTQTQAWRIDHPRSWNSGLVSTAGNLLFQGLENKVVIAMRADTGEQLWSFDAQTGVVGSPVTYSIDGEQYVAFAAGWGGALALGGGVEPGPQTLKSRILTFKLDGQAVLPPLPATPEISKPPARITDDEAMLDKGQELYINYCTICHGNEAVSNGRIPDLRHLPTVYYDNFNAIVLDGAMKKLGMVGFSDVLNEDDALALKAYILEEANEDWELQQQPDWWIAIKTWFYSIIAVVIGSLSRLA